MLKLAMMVLALCATLRLCGGAESAMERAERATVEAMVAEAKTSSIPSYRLHLVEAIAKRGRGGRNSTKGLLDLTLNAKYGEVSSLAGGYLANRVIDFPMTEEQITNLVARISTENSLAAAHWAYLLARATNVDHHLIIGPLIKCYCQAITEAKDINTPPHGNIFDAEGSHLNRFTRVFPLLKTEIAVPVLRREIAAASDERTRLWLHIAAGMSGDASEAEGLLRVVNAANQSVSIRAQALEAYALALGEKSREVLEQYRDDTTPGPNPRYPPLRVIARDELFKLQRAAR